MVAARHWTTIKVMKAAIQLVEDPTGSSRPIEHYWLNQNSFTVSEQGPRTPPLSKRGGQQALTCDSFDTSSDSVKRLQKTSGWRINTQNLPNSKERTSSGANYLPAYINDYNRPSQTSPARVARGTIPIRRRFPTLHSHPSRIHKRTGHNPACERRSSSNIKQTPGPNTCSRSQQHGSHPSFWSNYYAAGSHRCRPNYPNTHPNRRFTINTMPKRQGR